MYPEKNGKENILRKAAAAGGLAAAGVVLSFVYIPVGPVKCFPFQHAINVIAGITLGPLWAVGAAFTTSLIRNMIGTGSLFAFPGSIFGALFVGFASEILPCRFKWTAALAEPLGTGIIGAWASAVIIAPVISKNLGFAFLSVSFLISSIPGSILGILVLYCLKKRKCIESIGIMI